MTRGLAKLFFNFFFPLKCLGCSLEGGLACDSCLTAIPLFQNPFFFCQRNTGLDGIFVGAPFTADDLLQTLIHQFKYRYAQELAVPLATLYPKLPTLPLVPVPLHTNRLRERGFNQSELLAYALAPDLVFPCLSRVRDTPSQATLSRAERLKNVHDAFAVTRHDIPKKIILIDDVASTLATLSACAKLLRQHGAKKVYAAVLARSGLV